MSHTVLLYGATGYSGRLIAAEAAARGMRNSPGLPGFRTILAGRDGPAVAAVAQQYGLEARPFDLTDRDDVIRELGDVDVVINAAGPFALTANFLAKGALAAGCHYVDINGEADVYMRIDDLGRFAAQRNLAMVSGAGHTAAASDILLDVALGQLRERGGDEQASRELSVRLAMSRLTNLSRGSVETISRSLREQVRVVRMGSGVDEYGKPRRQPVFWHEPVGRLERTFDFFDPIQSARDQPVPPDKQTDLRIATAVNVVDTLTARLTVERHGFVASRIESYLEAGTIARLLYQFGSLLAPLTTTDFTRQITTLPLSALPAGPTPAERARETHFLVLEIEDAFQQRLINWGWHTPNPYDFTARVVIEIARRLCVSDKFGWLTPAAVLEPTLDDLTLPNGYLIDSSLKDRLQRREHDAILADDVRGDAR